MASNRPRSGIGVRILMGVARVLAAVVIAVAASAALADLDVRPIEFSRILPVVLTGEGIVYILMLGGGSVAAPVLLLSVIFGFALRAGIAVAAGALSPQVSGDLIASAKFYWASYWPAAAAQVLMVAVALRLIKPMIATRRRRMRRGRPQVSDALRDDRHGEERRDVLLEALAEAPDEPPVSPTVLEERQIGDLTEAVERNLTEEEVAQALSLPFDEEEPEEPEEEAPAEEPEESLPPGVIDATPEAMTAEETEREEAEVPEAASAPEPSEEVAAEVPATEVEEPSEERPAPEEEGEEAEPGEDTARLAPVEAPAPPAVGEIEPPENLQGMVDVISGAAGEGTDVRVWRTSDGRTVLAAVPSGTPAAGTGGHADALVSAHLDVCGWLGAEATCQQLAATSIGAWALQALDESGAVMLIMAARGDAAAGRMQLAAERAADAVRGMAEAAGPGEGAPEAPNAAAALPLSPEKRVAQAVNDAAGVLAGRFPSGWEAWRGPHRRIIAVHVSPGRDVASAGRNSARMAAPIERFADAVALDAPDWVAVSAGPSLLVMQWGEYDGEPMVLAALVTDGAAVGRVRWELDEIARLVAQR